jgi:hypothetical protein
MISVFVKDLEYIARIYFLMNKLLGIDVFCQFVFAGNLKGNCALKNNGFNQMALIKHLVTRTGSIFAQINHRDRVTRFLLDCDFSGSSNSSKDIC